MLHFALAFAAMMWSPFHVEMHLLGGGVAGGGEVGEQFGSQDFFTPSYIFFLQPESLKYAPNMARVDRLQMGQLMSFMSPFFHVPETLHNSTFFANWT